MTSLLTQPGPLQPGNDLRPALITLDRVNFSRGTKEILSDVSLSIRRGDFMVITGPNGGGKTTLLRLILGLLKPTAGTVKECRHDIRTGYLPQKSRIDSSYPISVREVVSSGLLSFKDIAKEEKQERVEEVLRQVELTAHANKPIGALSGGQQQRALLARAIISRPEVLVLDEPLSYLDKHFEQRVYDIIGRLAKNTTIIMVSHEIDTVATMANRHIIVNRMITQCQSAHHFVRVALCQ